jgi:hypothetical protein
MRFPIKVLKEEHIDKLLERVKQELLHIKETIPEAEEIIIKIEFIVLEGKPMVNINIDTYTSLSKLIEHD